MSELVSLELTLVGSDEHAQVVFGEDGLCDVRAEVAAASSERVGLASVLHPWITPEYVKNLRGICTCLVP